MAKQRARSHLSKGSPASRLRTTAHQRASRPLARTKQSKSPPPSNRAREQAALLQLTHDSLIVRDVHDRVTFWNRGAEEQYGWTKLEALGQVTDTLLRTVFPRPQPDIWAELAAHGHWEGELTRTRRDGDCITVASRWTLQRDKRGNPTAILETNTDITASKRTERELQRLNAELERRTAERTAELAAANQALRDHMNERAQSAERLRSVFMSLPHLVVIFHRRGDDFVLTDHNHAAVTYSQGAIARAVGSTAREIFSARPDIAERIERAYAERTASRYAGPCSIFSLGDEKYTIMTFTFLAPDRVIMHVDDATEQWYAEEKTRHQNAVLAGMNHIFRQAFTSMTDEELGMACLQVAEQVTGSKFGFIGELNAEGRLDDIAISDPGWEQCQLMPRAGDRRVPLGFKVYGLYGRVLLDGKGLYTNDPATHSDSIGLPKGHPPLTAFLGVPLVHNGRTIGMIGLGNREGGYREEDLEAATSIANAAVQALVRKRAEQALQDSERRERARSEELETLLDAVPAAVWITQDPEAAHITGNRLGHDWLKLPAGANLSKSAPEGERPETFTLFKNGVALAATDLPVQRAARGEEIRDYEFDFCYPDGTTRTVAGNATPLHDEEGKPYGAVSAFIDITERKHTEDALKQAMQSLEMWARELELARANADRERNHSQAVMDALPVGVAIVDSEGRTLRANQAYEQVWGGPRPWALSTEEYAAYHARWAGTSKPVAPEEWASVVAIQKGEPVIGQLLEIQRSDGRRAWIINSASPVRDGNGKIVGSAVAIQDITELRRTEESLREAMHQIQKLNLDMEQRTNELEVANEELERLGVSLAYDLRAPLISINSVSNAIVQDYGAQLPREAYKLFELIHANTREMDQLTDGLVRMMRITRQSVHKQTVDMETLVRTVWSEHASQYADRQVEVTVGPLPTCEGDPLLLKEVWANLISNALKFTRSRRPACIEIGARPEGSRTVYYIKDNGAGFDMAYAGRIFRAFQRYHHPDEFEGAGVGLAIVEGIVRRHGGRVWAEGSVDQGATVYLMV